MFYVTQATYKVLASCNKVPKLHHHLYLAAASAIYPKVGQCPRHPALQPPKTTDFNLNHFLHSTKDVTSILAQTLSLLNVPTASIADETMIFTHQAQS